MAWRAALRGWRPGGVFRGARAAAANRIVAAIAAHPFHVGGTGRFDTEAMAMLQGRAITKTGAEGVFCAAAPELGLGLAVKIDDGATRAAEVGDRRAAGALRRDAGGVRAAGAAEAHELARRRGRRDRSGGAAGGRIGGGRGGVLERGQRPT